MKPPSRSRTEVFRRADELARRLGKSRSQLYREALAECLCRREPRSVTHALDQLVDQLARGCDSWSWKRPAGRSSAASGSQPRQPSFGADERRPLRHESPNVFLGLDSVANVSQVVCATGVLSERVGHPGEGELALVLAGTDLLLGRA